MTWPVISDDPRVQRHYEHCREQGTGHLLSEMFATSQPPNGVSDCTFMRDTANGKQFAGQDHIGDFYRKVAEEAGVSVTGKKYISGLASFPGDPKAWIDSRGDVQRICEERGYGCDGSITVKARERLDPPKPSFDGVADDILNREVMEVCAQVPDGHMVDRVDLKEQVRAKRRPKKHA